MGGAKVLDEAAVSLTEKIIPCGAGDVGPDGVWDLGDDCAEDSSGAGLGNSDKLVLPTSLTFSRTGEEEDFDKVASAPA